LEKKGRVFPKAVKKRWGFHLGKRASVADQG